MTTGLLTGCARCGKDHGIELKEFAGETPKGYTHWGTCPETGQPVLAYIAELSPEGDVDGFVTEGFVEPDTLNPSRHRIVVKDLPEHWPTGEYLTLYVERRLVSGD